MQVVMRIQHWMVIILLFSLFPLHLLADSTHPEIGEAKQIMRPLIEKAWFPGQQEDKIFAAINGMELSFMPGNFCFQGPSECLAFCRVKLPSGLTDGLLFLFKKVNGKWADGRWFETGILEAKPGNADNDSLVDLIIHTEIPGSEDHTGILKVVSLKGGRAKILYQAATFDKSKMDLSKVPVGQKIAENVNLYLADTNMDGKNEIVEVVEIGFVADKTKENNKPIRWTKQKNIKPLVNH
jgi:hypothetical protein